MPSERLTRSGQQRSPSLSSVQPSKPKPVSSKRGRKRKSTVDSNADFDVSHFMDGQVCTCNSVCPQAVCQFVFHTVVQDSISNETSAVLAVVRHNFLLPNFSDDHHLSDVSPESTN